MQKAFIFAIALSVVALTSGAVSQSPLLFSHMGEEPTQYNTMDELNILGDADTYEDFLRLTPADTAMRGAAWYADRKDVEQGFSTIFQFQITELGEAFCNEAITNTGGDGLAFVIQNHSGDALGGGGGNMGYGWLSNCVAVEFDTWNNDVSGHAYVDDPNDNHISVHTSSGTHIVLDEESCSIGCATDQSELRKYAEENNIEAEPEIFALPDFNDGNVHTVIVEYEPGLMSIYIDDLEIPALNVEIDLSEILNSEDGKAWVGFTAATGKAYENHDILNWAFTGEPIEDSEPTTRE